MTDRTQPQSQPPATAAINGATAVQPNPQRSNFLLANYSCRGSLQFDSDDFKNERKPHCFGFEQKIYHPVEFQEHIRRSFSNDDDASRNDGPFEKFKKERSKAIALNTKSPLFEEGEADYSSLFLTDADGEELIPEFNYNCYGKTFYTTMEFPEDDRELLLNPPKCTTGLTVREEDAESYFTFGVLSFQVTSDISHMDPKTREDYMRFLREQKDMEDRMERQQPQRQQQQLPQSNSDEGEVYSFEVDFGKYGQMYKESAVKTIENMKKITVFVAEQLQDDFPERMVESSGRIISHFGTTVTQCKKTADDITSWWRDDGDEEDP